MNIKNLPVEERPMERMLRLGPETLSNAELMALIVHTGFGDESAIGLSERIISSLEGGIRGLIHTTPQELMQIKGVGKSKACALIASAELNKRFAATAFKEDVRISSAREVADLFMEDLRFQKKEYFKTLLLDTKGKIIHVDQVSVGGLAMAPVHPREVFASAIKRSAASIIMIHNHPSGDPFPSGEDDILTARLVEAGKLVGIVVQDHIIIGDGEYYSYAGMGRMG